MEKVEFIVGEKPPNWETLERTFAVKWGTTVVTYGNCVYSSRPISPDLVAHELVHVRQQGEDPNGWWTRYIKDSKFRMEQEIEAHKVQMKYIKKHFKDRNYLVRMRTNLARYLSGTMYGKCISFNEAYKYLA